MVEYDYDADAEFACPICFTYIPNPDETLVCPNCGYNADLGEQDND